MTRLRLLVTAVRRAVAAGRLEAYRYLRDQREARGARDVPGVTCPPADGRSPLGPDVGVGAEVVVHFADAPDNLYQLRQWLPILSLLHARHPVAIVCRSSATAELLERETDLPVAVIRPFRDLGAFYAAADVKVCLYVNNHDRNFQSLAFADQLHVHLNHGESDKPSMASNQAKAYDHVLVAGPVAVERYRGHLLRYDGGNLLEVGRPQLDLPPPSRASDGGGRTVLYAPTWEGGRDEMDHSSLATMGEAIVTALATNGWRVVYRPHPKAGVDDPTLAAADQRIVAVLHELADDGAGHRVSPAGEPIGEAIADVDVVIADVSSVLLDALPTGKPVLVTRPPGACGHVLDAGTTSLAVAYPLTPGDLPRLSDRLEAVVADDPLRDDRAAAVARFFGDTTPGASTRRFLAAIDAIVAERDRLVATKRARPGARETSREAT